MNGPRLRVLIVEDVQADAELIAANLIRSGFDTDYDRVDALNPLRSALARPGWDLVLTDYRMPTLTVPTVLQMMSEQRVTVPCLLVSGTASEETARASMRLGMTDFVSKHNLAELGPVVARVLKGGWTRDMRLRIPRLRLASGHELQVMEWSSERRLVDGETPLRPDSKRDGLYLQAEEATRVRVHVTGCQVHKLTAESVVYRSELTLVAA